MLDPARSGPGRWPPRRRRAGTRAKARNVGSVPATAASSRSAIVARLGCRPRRPDGGEAQSFDTSDAKDRQQQPADDVGRPMDTEIHVVPTPTKTASVHTPTATTHHSTRRRVERSDKRQHPPVAAVANGWPLGTKGRGPGTKRSPTGRSRADELLHGALHQRSGNGAKATASDAGKASPRHGRRQDRDCHDDLGGTVTTTRDGRSRPDSRSSHSLPRW